MTRIFIYVYISRFRLIKKKSSGYSKCTDQNFCFGACYYVKMLQHSVLFGPSILHPIVVHSLIIEDIEVHPSLLLYHSVIRADAYDL